MFGKNVECKRVTVRLYPQGSIRGEVNTYFDFGKGDEEVVRYNHLCEKYKKLSLDAQADTSEVQTLVDDTLKVTFLIEHHAFTISSELILPNVDYVKALAHMSAEELSFIEEKYNQYRANAGADLYPDIFEFEAYIRQAIEDASKDLGSLDATYTVEFKIHDSYTKLHKEAIEYIVKALVKDGYTFENGVISFTSDDLQLRKAVTDLSMSKYYDITIKE